AVLGLLAVGGVQVDGVGAAARAEHGVFDAAVADVDIAAALNGGVVPGPGGAVIEQHGRFARVVDRVGLADGVALVVQVELVLRFGSVAVDQQLALDVVQHALLFGALHGADVDAVLAIAAVDLGDQVGIGDGHVEGVGAHAQQDAD